MDTEGAPTILIVEDDPGIAELERTRLEEVGYRTTVTATAEDAMEEIRDSGADLILLDFRLPGGISGLDFYAQLKAAGYDPPVILVTGFSDEMTVIRSLRSGVRDFITKSLEYLDYLPEAVARVLRQVQIERRLTESEARLAGVIESVKDAVIVVEADHRVSLFNPAAERMFECSAAAAIGRPITDFIPDEHGTLPVQVAASVEVSGANQLAAGNEGVRASGERFPVEVSASRGDAGGRRFYTLVARDVTTRKQAEEDLRRTTALLQAVIDGTTDAVFVKDRAGRYLLANEAAGRFVGREAEAILGQDDTALFDPAGARRIKEKHLAVMETGRPDTHEDTLTAAGVTRTFLTTLAPYRDEQGDIIGVMGIARDVTERRRLTAERDELLARLQLHVERMPLAYILFDANLVTSQ
ncbi:MAG: PAS domain S-box protein [Gemmataceae bacterium]|nr:PAS domain S-box protein [Gemmataceae bacterium]